MNTTSKQKILWILIPLIAALLFIPLLGQVHLFDWDEINFAEAAREMIVTNDYLTVQIDYQPFWEKPPLFIWTQVVAMKLFGVNEFAARLPNAVCGVITLLMLYGIGKKLYNNKFALYWVLAHAGAVLPHFYFKSGIIDPWFNFFIFIGVWYFASFHHSKQSKQQNLYIALSGTGIGLAVLTKGPVAFLVFFLTVGIFFLLSLINRFKLQTLHINLKLIVLFCVPLILTGGLWFIIQIISGNFQVVVDFILYQIRLLSTQDSGHKGFLFYHFVILLIGVFPTSVIALKAFKKQPNDNMEQHQFRYWMLILFWVVLVLFSIVQTKIIHYSSLCYFPLSFLAAYTIYKLKNYVLRWQGWLNALLLFIGSLIAILVGSLPFIDKYKQAVFDANIIKDNFAVANLRANVHWSGYEFLIGVFLLIGIIASIFFIKKRFRYNGIIGLLLVTMMFTNLTMMLIVPRIEGYTQRAAIQFYEDLQGREFYIETLGFKSYAHLFYTRKKKVTNPKSYKNKWLLTGDIDKDAYFVCKVNRKEKYQKKYSDLELLYEKNGFVFFIRRCK